MSGLNSLRSIFQKKGEQYVADLMNSYIVVNEKLEGSYFAALLDSDNNFTFFKKGSEITYADRVLSRFYNTAISHFENLPEAVKQDIPSFYLFAMQYFPKDKRLVLSHIHELSADGKCTRTIQDKQKLDSWANKLQIEQPAILFEGRLNDEQKSALLQLIDAPKEEFEHIPFERALLSIFGITEARSLNSVVFRFYENESRDEETAVIAKFASPAIESLLKERPPKDITKIKPDDFVWLILVDLMNYIETFTLVDLKGINLTSKNKNIRYVQLINELYKKYMTENGNKWEGLELNVPEHLKEVQFGLNTDLITDQKVKEILQQSSINTEIYKILLNMFRNPNFKIASKIFTDNMKSHLRNQIEKLHTIAADKQINEMYFPTFTEFLGLSKSYSVFEEQEPEVKKNCNVNVLIDYFQPINKSHIKVAQKLNEKNNNKVIFIAVSQVQDHSKYPLNEDTTLELLTRVKEDYSDLIEDIRVIPNWSIEAVLESLNGDYVPTLLACTTKRIMDFSQHIEYYRKKKSSSLGIVENLQLVEVEQNEFGNIVRQTLIDKNDSEFKKLTPKSIHPLFETLSDNYSDAINESYRPNDLLQEHVQFLKMVIAEDSNVTIAAKSAIVTDLKTVKLKLTAKESIDQLKSLIIEKQISEKDASSFIDKIINESCISETDIINFTSLIKLGVPIHTDKVMLVKLDTIFEQWFINPIILDHVLSYKLQEHDGSGVGEFATAILFRGAEKLQKNGDVSINEQRIEVKNNNSQLLSIKSINEDATFKDSAEVLNKKIGKLKELVLSSNSDAVAESLTLIDAKFENKNNFNFNQKGIRNYVTLFKDLSNLIPEIEVAKLYEWFASLFIGGILNEESSLPEDSQQLIVEQIKSVFESKSDAKSLLSRLTFLAFKYYSKVDDFSGMMIYRNTTDSTKRACVYIPESVEYDDYIKFIEPITGPSIIDPRTSKSFKIRMKAIE